MNFQSLLTILFVKIVRAFDPNVEESVTHPNIHFKKMGLSGESGTLKNTAADGTVRQMPVLSLLDSIKLFGDEVPELRVFLAPHIYSSPSNFWPLLFAR